MDELVLGGPGCPGYDTPYDEILKSINTVEKESVKMSRSFVARIQVTYEIEYILSPGEEKNPNIKTELADRYYQNINSDISPLSKIDLQSVEVVEINEVIIP